jgi:hypothetical protein
MQIAFRLAERDKEMFELFRVEKGKTLGAALIFALLLGKKTSRDDFWQAVRDKSKYSRRLKAQGGNKCVESRVVNINS